MITLVERKFLYGLRSDKKLNPVGHSIIWTIDEEAKVETIIGKFGLK